MPKGGGSDDNSGSLGSRDKSRGIKHQKDKTKYKPNSVKDPRHVPPKSKRNLGSNWDRYEAGEDAQVPRLTSSTDFSILANAPISQGQHFQFKQDKIIAGEIEKTSQELFSLDLNMLKHSVVTVPFYKRVDIDEKYFSENQISFMNKNAETSLAIYNEKYNANRSDKPAVGAENVSNKPVSASENKDAPDLPSNQPSNETEINEDGSEVIVTETKNLVKSETPQETTEDDLEQWLDDILDD